jgi:hypothetical protein
VLGDYLESGAAAFHGDQVVLSFQSHSASAARVIVEYHRTIRFSSIFGCKPRFRCRDILPATCRDANDRSSINRTLHSQPPGSA